MQENTSYEKFESIFMEQLNKYAPMKQKYVNANNAPFMNKALCKANYKKQRNYCLNLLRKEKTKITKSRCK